MKELEIVLLPHEASQHQAILAAIQKVYPAIQSNKIQILKRSVDARGKQPVFRLKIAIYDLADQIPVTENIKYQNVKNKKEVHIVGAGPAGLFAALRLIELGLKPIIIERGKDVKQRRRDLATINKEGILNPESNYCFGEGGAGTYSDGKLYTRSNKRGDVNKILQIFIQHGADQDIAINARPHIGTNKLPGIITTIRETILNAGGEIHFETKFTGLKHAFGKIEAIITNKETIKTDALILATGHSARDVYSILNDNNLQLEAKPFALGVRIEHPQQLINELQYHTAHQDPHLPPSYYSLAEQVDNRGVFSFCMCPGGIIAPCATAQNEIVVNGWSPSKRNNPYANSGTVVQINLVDVPNSHQNPFAMLNFQQQIEQAAYQAGGGNQVAPAQRMVDFVNNKYSTSLPKNSYLPGLKSIPLKEILPAFVHHRLIKALPVFGKKMQLSNKKDGYFTNEAVLVGVESRTSSPIRIPRNKQTLQHPQLNGLFPCAEGAGFAGGIVSAAIDGEQCANAVFNHLN